MGSLVDGTGLSRLTRYRNFPGHVFREPGKARLRGRSHVQGHARQSTGVYAEALLLTLDPVALPDERLEVIQAVPDQRKSSGPGRRRSRASSSQTWRPVKLPRTRLARHCPRHRSSQGWDLLHPSIGGTTRIVHRSYGREARLSTSDPAQEGWQVVQGKAVRWLRRELADRSPS